MSAAQHTPGPWAHEVDGSTHNDMRHAVLAKSTGLWVAATYRSGTRPENDTSPEADAEAAANARLIAAAPDLLHMLLIALPYVEDAQADPCYKPGAVATVVRQMRAAIAQADPCAGVTA